MAIVKGSPVASGSGLNRPSDSHLSESGELSLRAVIPSASLVQATSTTQGYLDAQQQASLLLCLRVYHLYRRSSASVGLKFLSSSFTPAGQTIYNRGQIHKHKK
eukprot:1189664-Prorocentrum_minimum.AAC.4